MCNYIKTRGYGWETLALTWEEGTATVTGDTLTLKPTTGKYKVIDNRVAKNSYERPMTPEEIKTNVKTRTWSRETDPGTGKPVLKMGGTTYKRGE